MYFRSPQSTPGAIGKTPTDAITIRPAMRAEMPAISDLIAIGLRRFRGQVPDIALDLYINHSTDVAARWNDGTVLTAHFHGRLAGTVTWYPQADLGLPSGWASFGTLVVDPEMSRRGVGSLLVRRCVTMAAEISSAIGIHTGSFMQPARRLYESLGFVRLPEHDHRASSIFGFDPAVGDIDVLAYELGLR